MRSILSALSKALLVAGIVLAAFLYLFPEYRQGLWGIKLAYAAPQEEKRSLIMVIRISEGREVRGSGASAEDVELSDVATLEAALEETTVTGGPEFGLDYKLTQVRSEQFAWNQPKPGKLSGFHWQARIGPRGSLSGVKLEEHSNALWNREDVAWFWLSGLWPALPASQLHPGDTWTGEVRAFATLPEKPEGFALVIRPQYTLDRIRQENGKAQAELHWDGTVSDDGSGGKVAGLIRGRAVNGVDDKRCLIADFAADVAGDVPLSTPRGVPEGESMHIVWHQKIEGRIYRTAAPVATPTRSN